MKFLKLEGINGNMVRINFDAIESYVRVQEANHTMVAPVGYKDDGDCYRIKETPEQIDEMLGELNE